MYFTENLSKCAVYICIWTVVPSYNAVMVPVSTFVHIQCGTMDTHLHNAIPVVTSSNAKQGEESHSKILEVSMFTQSFTWMFC